MIQRVSSDNSDKSVIDRTTGVAVLKTVSNPRTFEPDLLTRKIIQTDPVYQLFEALFDSTTLKIAMNVSIKVVGRRDPNSKKMVSFQKIRTRVILRISDGEGGEDDISTEQVTWTYAGLEAAKMQISNLANEIRHMFARAGFPLPSEFSTPLEAIGTGADILNRIGCGFSGMFSLPEYVNEYSKGESEIRRCQEIIDAHPGLSGGMTQVIPRPPPSSRRPFA